MRLESKIQTITWGRAALVSFVLLGCGPSRVELPPPATEEGRQVAKALCAVRQACGCSDARFASDEECKSEVASIFDAAVEGGLILDSECLQAALDSEIIQGCPTWPWQPEMLSCIVLQGSKGEGERCTTYSGLQPFSVSDCNEGLLCHDGKCRADFTPPAPLQSGDSCNRDVGCGTVDLYCGRDGRCHELRDEGDSCDDYMACGGGLYCRGLGAAKTGTCVMRVAAGGACEPKDWGACDSPDFPDTVYWCDSGTSTCTPGQPAVCRLTHPAAG